MLSLLLTQLSYILFSGAETRPGREDRKFVPE